MDNKFPINDDYMVYDEFTGRYRLTEAALIARGVNLRARIQHNKTVDATAVINTVCDRASELVYNFIHQYSIYNERQDRLIACCGAYRQTFMRILLDETLYIVRRGDVTMEGEPLDAAISATVKTALEAQFPGSQVSILYAGG